MLFQLLFLSSNLEPQATSYQIKFVRLKFSTKLKSAGWAFLNRINFHLQRFQQMEEKHLGEMRGFVERYHQAREVHSEAICKVRECWKRFGGLWMEQEFGILETLIFLLSFNFI